MEFFHAFISSCPVFSSEINNVIIQCYFCSYLATKLTTRYLAIEVVTQVHRPQVDANVFYLGFNIPRVCLLVNVFIYCG